MPLDHALALDPNLPETHLALGYYRYYGQRDFTGGLEEFQQAEKGLPNNVDIINAIAFIQRRLGHWEEAIAGLRRAIELDPRNTNAYNSLAITYSALRRFPEALATLDRVLAWEPTNADALGDESGVPFGQRGISRRWNRCSEILVSIRAYVVRRLCSSAVMPRP